MGEKITIPFDPEFLHDIAMEKVRVCDGDGCTVHFRYAFLGDSPRWEFVRYDHKARETRLVYDHPENHLIIEIDKHKFGIGERFTYKGNVYEVTKYTPSMYVVRLIYGGGYGDRCLQINYDMEDEMTPFTEPESTGFEKDIKGCLAFNFGIEFDELPKTFVSKIAEELYNICITEHTRRTEHD